MNKQEKAALIQQVLNDLFPAPQIPLCHKDPFTLLIATLLSAQCTDERVNKVTKELFRVADTPKKMAALPPSLVEEIIRSCGLAPKKSLAIVALSKILEEKYGGQVPQTFEELESLPGVGHKTASVVMVQSFGVPAFPVDTHIHRLATRWGLTTGQSVQQTEKDLKKLFPQKDWCKLHLQLIYFGRTFCPAKKHTAAHCPICSQLS